MTPPETTARAFSEALLEPVCEIAHDRHLVVITACAEVAYGDDGEPQLGNFATCVQLGRSAALRPLAHQLAGLLEDSLTERP
jgi:hypothetical protein